MGWNEKCGYRPEIWRNTQNTEQIRIRVFLEVSARRTQIPPHPNHPRDKILKGFLCGVHRRGNAARSRRRVGDHVATSGFFIACATRVTKFRKDFCAGCTEQNTSRPARRTAGVIFLRFPIGRAPAACSGAHAAMLTDSRQNRPAVRTVCCLHRFLRNPQGRMYPHEG